MPLRLGPFIVVKAGSIIICGGEDTWGCCACKELVELVVAPFKLEYVDKGSVDAWFVQAAAYGVTLKLEGFERKKLL
jgi:hypothetical protein